MNSTIKSKIVDNNYRLKNDWNSYNEIVDIYDSIMVPHLVMMPARDLLTALDLPRGAKVLDVGTGTGVGALIAKQVVGSAGFVTGLDLSIGMLRCASNKGLSNLVCGIVPGLPCRDETFDRIMTIFVLSHIQQYQTALSDMARVLRSGGKLGVSAWGNRKNEADQVWLTIAENFVCRDHIDKAVLQALPSEEKLTNPDILKEALQLVGLKNIAIIYNEYEVIMTVNDYLQFKNHGISGRFVKSALPANQWEKFKEKVSNELIRIFDRQVELKLGAYLTVGIKPAI
jgi:ubiquinone/menaquinone biosynthesis C-methylase UbiE